MITSISSRSARFVFLVALGTGVAVLGATPAAAVCDTSNSLNPENDCDNDGQTVGAGDCVDCDIDRVVAGIPDCSFADPTPGSVTFANPATVKLGGPEICDGFDNTCNSVVDEGFDVDGDGFTSCGGDCNDSVGSIHPGVAEDCDGVDQDCDSVADASENLTRSCYTGPGGTNNVGECHGGTETCTGASYGACVGEQVPVDEICDTKNNDCDADGADEGLRVDVDGDTVRACGTCGAPAAPACDCNDANASIRPGATEQCDGVDQDCDNVADGSENITRSCYDNFLPPGGTAGVGACTFGTETCTGVTFGACTGDGTGASVTETCNNVDDDCDGTRDDGLVVDGDGDGSRACGSCGAAAAPGCDCNDGNGAIKPGVTETCNNVDDDCDAMTDERNGAGDPLTRNCYTGPGGTNNVGTCHGGTETCAGGAFGSCVGEQTPVEDICDGFNNDCDAQGADEGLITDGDADGTPACGSACLLPPFNTPTTCDCDDGDPLNEPGRTEVCDGQDNNCNTLIDEGFDQDADGFLSCSFCSNDPCDCNDNDNTVFPGAPEDCGPVDKNCDGNRFDGFTDADGDGVPSCSGSECDDAHSNVHGAYGPITAVVDTCDGFDNDCNGTVDRAVNGSVISQACYDGPAGTVGVGECKSGNHVCAAVAGSGVSTFGTCDGQTVPTNPPASDETICNNKDDDCDNAPDDGFDDDADGFSTCEGDCDDQNGAVNPNAVEVCDGVDQNCDASLTDVPALRCFEGPNVTSATFEGVCPGPGCAPRGACVAGERLCAADGTLGVCGGALVLPANDPAGPEALCNFIDDDCDGTVDDGPFDVDGDGFTTCGGDCDDADPGVNPGALELCDNVDNNCDAVTDGAQTQCYSADVATEGLGLCHAGTSACVAGSPQGDCVDEVTPAEETCDTFDNDCDGKADEDFDADGDNYPDCASCPALNAAQCDCDDADPFNHPGQRDFCDCQDNNCDSLVDEGDACRGAPCHDFDGDGLTNCNGDCDDANAAVNANRPERAGNGVDDDCDGAIDEDVDEDGDGYTVGQGDCDDRFAEIHPGAVEACDLFDNDCNGSVDEGFDLDGDGAKICVGDCDDNDNTRSPFRREICANGVDDNCDGTTDEDTDADGDGVTTCQGDCNDYNADVHAAFGDIPAAPEMCDGQDNDCNGPSDEGFDTDGDRVAVCFGDCNDNDAAISPLAFEVPANGIDDNCIAGVDENDDDQDGDGFTGACGDCNDRNEAINPHASEVCDRIDNNCDAYVDALPGSSELCAVCFDNDGDQFTNCDGDCDDADGAVFPGALEVCNGIDDDCDRRVDLTVDGLRVCGAEEDGGVPEPDAGVDAGGEGELEDAGVIDRPDDEISLGCTCAGGDSRASAAMFAGVLVLLAGFRRRRSGGASRAARLWGVTLAGGAACVVGGLPACTCDGVTLPDGVDLVAEGEGEGEGEGDGEGEGEGDPDCDPGRARVLVANPVPGASSQFAVPADVDAVELAAVTGLAVDSAADVTAILLVRPLPDGIDPALPGAAAEILGADSALLDALPGAPVVASRVQTGQRVFVTRDVTAAPSAQATYRLDLAGPTTGAQVRNRVAQALSGAEAADLADLPPPQQGAAFSDAMAMSVFVRIVGAVSVTVVALSPFERIDENQALLSDLTNGTHLGPPETVLDRKCEIVPFPFLRSDFIFVVDNSGSMQEEQQALSNAAVTFNDALVSSGLDARLAVITTDSDVLRGSGFTQDVTAFEDDVKVGISGNGFEMGLEYAARAVLLAEANPLPERAFREDAARIVIVFTDEEAAGLETTAEYASFFIEHGVILYAIAGPRPTGCQFVGLGTAVAGNAYIEVAQATGGTSASICNPNLGEAIADILVGAAGAASRSPLTQTPVSGSIAVAIERNAVARSREDGFDYEAASNTVLLFGSRPVEGTPVAVSYAYFNRPGG